MPKSYLRGKDAERIDLERQELEARFAELRKKEEVLSAQQRELIGAIMLDLVASGEWTEAQLHDFLRPHIRRKKDAKILGIDLDGASSDQPDVATNTPAVPAPNTESLGAGKATIDLEEDGFANSQDEAHNLQR